MKYKKLKVHEIKIRSNFELDFMANFAVKVNDSYDMTFVRFSHQEGCPDKHMLALFIFRKTAIWHR